MTNPLALQMVIRSLHTPFYIPQSEITAWKGIASYSLHPPHPTDSSWRRHVALQVNLSAPENIPVSTVIIYLGLCMESPLGGPKHWAMIAEYRERPESEAALEHVCSEHHIDEQPTQTHPLTIYNDKLLTSHHSISPLSPGMRMCLELSFPLYPLSFTHCHRVCIRFNPTEDDVGSEDDESMVSSDREEVGEWVTMKEDWESD